MKDWHVLRKFIFKRNFMDKMAFSGEENIENSKRPIFKRPIVVLNYRSQINTAKLLNSNLIDLELASSIQYDDILDGTSKISSNESLETSSSVKEEKPDNSRMSRGKQLRSRALSNTFQQEKNHNTSVKMLQSQNSDHTVLGREKEYLQIKQQTKTFLGLGASSILFITGVPGSGKTHTALSVLNHMKVPYSYVNTASLKSKLHVYKEIWYGLSCSGGASSLSGLRFHFNNCSSSHIVVIDEIDLLSSRNDRYLYNLFELPFFENSKVFMIVISNTLKKLGTKIESRIGKNRMEFVPYKSHQIASIIENEYDSSSMNKKSIEFVSKRVASSTGDIRKAKEIIANVGKKDVKAANDFFKELSMPLIERFIATFNIYHKMLIYLNEHPLLDVKTWFESHKTFCIVKNYNPLDFADFLFVLNDLVEFGIYSFKNDNTKVVCNFLEEEIDLATKKDPDFKSFSKK